jgi:hypothetical protein
MSLTKALYVNRVTSISSGLAGGGDQEGCSTALAVATAIRKTRRPGNDRSTHHLFQGYAVMKMSLRTQTATVMVLDCNSTNYAFNFCGAESILVQILSCDHTERARCSASCFEHLARTLSGSQTREAGILELVYTQRQA